MLKIESLEGSYVRLHYDGQIKIDYDSIVKDEFDEFSVCTDYQMMYRKTNIPGVYDFGVIQLEDDWEHKAGYIWASRASCVNYVFGTKFISCVVNDWSLAIDADVLLELTKELSDRYEIVFVEKDDEWRDIKYAIKKIKD